MQPKVRHAFVTGTALGLVAATAFAAVVWHYRDSRPGPASSSVQSASAGPTSSAGPTWSDSGTTNLILSGQGPAFPQTLVGWELQHEWTETTRAFTGQWSSVCGSDACTNPYPATMNGCSNQRFLVRWRSLNDPVLFAYGEVTGSVDTVVEDRLNEAAQKGWAELAGCSWPLWQYPPGHPSTLGDVVVGVQHWAPIP
ncbi:hypothetical protein [Actinoplanes rectilineatus]|uniref:hypothetical protein n=1 Tax=Actinoplanes rectilineatus TaxID=113571 RepID=UPI0012FCACD0|nr:hypothetical protein [Actinoplanes rectilineatus]